MRSAPLILRTIAAIAALGFQTAYTQAADTVDALANQILQRGEAQGIIMIPAHITEVEERGPQEVLVHFRMPTLPAETWRSVGLTSIVFLEEDDGVILHRVDARTRFSMREADVFHPDEPGARGVAEVLSTSLPSRKQLLSLKGQVTALILEKPRWR